jgi:surface antigen
VAARAPSLTVALALALAFAGAAAGARPLVTSGYPYASRCTEAGERDLVDRWKMNMCNCTSFVAWALERNGFRTDWFAPGSMDAWNWPNVARLKGIRTGDDPRPGAVAVWPAETRFGHVAFVTAVHADETFDVAEYNLPGGRRFGFDTRRRLGTRGVDFVYVPRR